MSLPQAWVDKIFEKLTLTYGRAFLNRWSDIDLVAVKADWAHELAGYAQHPSAIAYGLAHVDPSRPPTVLEFRALCRRAPAPDLPRLPEPQADPSRVAEELAKLARLREGAARCDSREWARRVVARHQAGERVTRAALGMARSALGMEA